MILAGQLLLSHQTGSARIEPGHIRISGQHIEEVALGEIPSRYDAGGPNALISPGFIDAHLHLPQFDIIGAHGLPLLDWLNDFTFPAERKWEDVDFARKMTSRVLAQCFSVGTTGIAAYATVHHQSTIAALQVAANMGMRGVIGQVLMDRQAPHYLCVPSSTLLEQAHRTLELFEPSQRLSAAVTPRFAISCTPELLSGAGELAQQTNAIIQTHLSETERECNFVKELFDGRNYVQVYQDANLLNERTVFGHGIHLDPSDRKTLSAAKSVIAHCPTANSFLRSGTMNRKELQGDQVRLAIGSDIGAGYERSMVRVARAMIEAASSIGESFPTAAEAWHQITAGNASALGMEDAGALKAGNPADVLVIQPDIPWLDANVAPLSMLMFAWDDRWIEKTIVLGKTV